MRILRMKRLTFIREESDRGAVAILVSIFAVVMVGLAAFSVDFGQAYASRRAMSTGADGAALAGARELQINASGTDNCANLVAKNSSSAKSVASSYVTANAPAGTTSSTSVTCNGSGQALVTVTTTAKSPSYFGAVYGAQDYDLTRTATAMVAPAQQVSGIRPFGICTSDADKVLTATLGSAVQVPIVKFGSPSCGTAKGNWQALDFDGGSNGTEVQEWIEDGYNGPVTITPGQTYPVESDPGNNSGAKIQSEMNSILGVPILLPVFSTVASNGNNAVYQVTGFLQVKMCGWDINPKSGTGNSCYDASVGVAADSLQVRLERFIPVGEVGTCGIGAAACKYQPLLVKLVN